MIYTVCLSSKRLGGAARTFLLGRHFRTSLWFPSNYGKMGALKDVNHKNFWIKFDLFHCFKLYFTFNDTSYNFLKTFFNQFFISFMNYKQVDGNGNICIQRHLQTILHLVQDLVTALLLLENVYFFLEVLQMTVKILEVIFQGNDCIVIVKSVPIKLLEYLLYAFLLIKFSF